MIKLLLIIIIIIIFFIKKYNRDFFITVNNIDNKKCDNNLLITIDNNIKNYKNHSLTDINYSIKNSIFIDNKYLSLQNKINYDNNNYKLLGHAINPYNNIKYLLYEKYYKNNLYKYILINENEQSTNLPPRDKIYLNDIIFFKNYGYYRIII